MKAQLVFSKTNRKQNKQKCIFNLKQFLDYSAILMIF